MGEFRSREESRAFVGSGGGGGGNILSVTNVPGRTTGIMVVTTVDRSDHVGGNSGRYQ